MNQIDFQGLAHALLHRSRELLPEWLPGGKLIGREFTCGSIRGEDGQSLKVNIDSGKWKDFAADIKGGDLISLYAAIKDTSQIEAAKSLNAMLGLTVETKKPSRTTPASDTLVPPPAGVRAPNFVHQTHGRASGHWAYRDAEGSILFYVARFDNTVTKKKEFVPFSWSKQTAQWVKKGWPAPRPLYGLNRIQDYKNILIVEGEKKADAIHPVVQKTYAVVGWPNGASAWDKADWSAVYGKNILIWPDADTPGVLAAEGIAKHLLDHCLSVKVLDVKGLPEKWDAADAVAEGMDWEKFKAFAIPRVQVRAKNVNAQRVIPAKSVKAEVMPPEPPPYTEAEMAQQAQMTATIEHNVNITVNEGHGEITPTQSQLWHQYGLTLKQVGKGDNAHFIPIYNSDNVSRIFEHAPEFKGKLWYDEFHQKIFSSWRQPNDEPKPLNDIIENSIFHHMQRHFGLHQIAEAAVHSAVIEFAHKDVRNEPRDYMRSLKWDEQVRLDTFFQTYMSSNEPAEYLKAIGQNFWTSMVARVMDPGCKMDNAVVLEGSQGKKKSTALDAIAGKWFIETNEDPRNKDFFMVLQGALIVELAELDAFSRADLLTVKKTMSCRKDRFRPPYGRHVEDFPRMCIFVGTTNQDDYLKDPTGARRFWPCHTGFLDVDAIKRDRDQLFAEAVWRYDTGFPYWEVPEIVAKEIQEQRFDVDIWEEHLKVWCEDKKAFKSIDVLTSALSLEIGNADRRATNRIAPILRRLGYEMKPWRLNGKTEKMWVHPEDRKITVGESAMFGYGYTLVTKKPE